MKKSSGEFKKAYKAAKREWKKTYKSSEKELKDLAKGAARLGSFRSFYEVQARTAFLHARWHGCLASAIVRLGRTIAGAFQRDLPAVASGRATLEIAQR